MHNSKSSVTSFDERDGRGSIMLSPAELMKYKEFAHWSMADEVPEMKFKTMTSVADFSSPKGLVTPSNRSTAQLYNFSYSTPLGPKKRPEVISSPPPLLSSIVNKVLVSPSGSPKTLNTLPLLGTSDKTSAVVSPSSSPKDSRHVTVGSIGSRCSSPTDSGPKKASSLGGSPTREPNITQSLLSTLSSPRETRETFNFSQLSCPMPSNISSKPVVGIPMPSSVLRYNVPSLPLPSSTVANVSVANLSAGNVSVANVATGVPNVAIGNVSANVSAGNVSIANVPAPPPDQEAEKGVPPPAFRDSVIFNLPNITELLPPPPLNTGTTPSPGAIAPPPFNESLVISPQQSQGIDSYSQGVASKFDSISTGIFSKNEHDESVSFAGSDYLAKSSIPENAKPTSTYYNYFSPEASPRPSDDGLAPRLTVKRSNSDSSSVLHNRITSAASVDDIHLSEYQKSRKKSHKAAVEFLTTEKSYLAGLNASVKIMQRLKYCIALNRPIIKEEEITTLFGNVEDFQTLHTRMYKDLETAYFENSLLERLPEILHYYIPDFVCYSAYSISYEAALNFLKCLKESNVPFREFLELEELCEGLESFLITPVQRVPRYLMLTEYLYKQMLSEAQTIDEHPVAVTSDQPKRSLVEEFGVSVTRMKEVANDMNNAIHASEARKKVKLIQDVLFGGKISLVTPQRFCIRSGELKKLYSNTTFHLKNHQKYLFLLFNDILIYAERPTNVSPAVMKHATSLMGMEVESIADNSECSNAWTVKSTLTGKCFTMFAPTPAIKSLWLSEMNKYIKIMNVFVASINNVKLRKIVMEEYSDIEKTLKIQK